MFCASKAVATSALLITMCLPSAVRGHGRMTVPQARNGGDNGAVAGGPATVHGHGGYKHGICGNAPGVAQSYNMVGNPVATYVEDTVVEFEVQITAHHIGYFEFDLCTDASDLSEDCFSKNQLVKEGCDCECPNGLGTACQQCFQCRWAWKALCEGEVEYWPAQGYSQQNSPILPGQGNLVVYNYKMKYKIPPGTKTKKGVLRWHYMTTNSCTWAGSQPEEFWNCADIQIMDANGNFGPDINVNNDYLKTIPVENLMPAINSGKLKGVQHQCPADAQGNLIGIGAPDGYNCGTYCGDGTYSFCFKPGADLSGCDEPGPAPPPTTDQPSTTAATTVQPPNPECNENSYGITCAELEPNSLCSSFYYQCIKGHLTLTEVGGAQMCKDNAFVPADQCIPPTSSTCVSAEVLRCINDVSSYWPACSPEQSKTIVGPSDYEFGEYCSQQWADSVNAMMKDSAVNICGLEENMTNVLAQIAYETGYYSTVYQPKDGGAGLIHMIPQNWVVNAEDMDEIWPGNDYKGKVLAMGKSFFQDPAYGWRSVAAWYLKTHRVIPACANIGNLFEQDYNTQTECILGRVVDRSFERNTVKSCLAQSPTGLPVTTQVTTGPPATTPTYQTWPSTSQPPQPPQPRCKAANNPPTGGCTDAACAACDDNPVGWWPCVSSTPCCDCSGSSGTSGQPTTPVPITTAAPNSACQRCMNEKKYCLASNNVCYETSKQYCEQWASYTYCPDLAPASNIVETFPEIPSRLFSMGSEVQGSAGSSSSGQGLFSTGNNVQGSAGSSGSGWYVPKYMNAIQVVFPFTGGKFQAVEPSATTGLSMSSQPYLGAEPLGTNAIRLGWGDQFAATDLGNGWLELQQGPDNPLVPQSEPYYSSDDVNYACNPNDLDFATMPKESQLKMSFCFEWYGEQHGAQEDEPQKKDEVFKKKPLLPRLHIPLKELIFAALLGSLSTALLAVLVRRRFSGRLGFWEVQTNEPPMLEPPLQANGSEMSRFLPQPAGDIHQEAFPPL